MREFVRLMDREMRLQGVNHAELAKRAGLTRQAIYKILGGKSNLSFETASRIGKALGIEIQLSVAADR